MVTLVCERVFARGRILNSLTLRSPPSTVKPVKVYTIQGENVEVTRWLAKTVVGSSWGEMPEAVRKEATRSFFNWLGCAIGGVRHEAS
jgi:hypothetical protein